MRNSVALLAITVSAAWSIGAGPGSTLVSMTGHIPAAAARSTHLGHLPSNNQVSLAVSLKPNNQAGLADLIRRQHDPSDPQFGHYLTSAQFAQSFGAPPQSITQVTQYLKDRGLNVTRVHPNGLVIDASGAAADVENAFQVQLDQYQTANGHVGYAPLTDPLVSDSVSSQILGINGIADLVQRKPRFHMAAAKGQTGIGSGPDGGLSPSDIKTAYGLAGVTQTGAGQTLALFELDGYTATDVATYAAEYGIATPPTLENILVGGAPGTPSQTENPLEVTIDIELMMALAPGATKILVYEGLNTDAGSLDTYSKIASDNAAPQISTSWGELESDMSPTDFTDENAVFMEMAAQGQSIYASSGDSASEANGTSLSVVDPSTQPYVTSTGGTTLSVAANEAYASETTWHTSATDGGGGGISTHWTLAEEPLAVNGAPFQTGLGTTTNAGSTAMRMVPDVALNSDPNTGYSFYMANIFLPNSQGGFTETAVGFNLIGGTSCAAPLWAAFTALVNQARTAAKLPTLGFASLPIYQLASSSVYSTAFHDIADGSTNGFYPAVTGYDLATGWGSFKGAALFAALTSGTLPPYSPTGFTAAPYNTVTSLTWTAATGASSYAISRGLASTGPFTPVAPSVSATSYQDVGLTDGTPYFYQVTASNTAGTSGSSAVVSTTPALVVPRAPGNLAGKKGGS